MRFQALPKTWLSRAALCMGLFAILPSCSKDDFKNTGEKEKKNITGAITQSNDATPATAIARVAYHVTVKAVSGMELCTGAAEFIMFDNFELKPSGNLQCLMAGNVSLDTLFGGGDAQLKNEDMSIYKGFGMVQRKQNPMALAPGLAQFNPPKPAFVGPIVQDPEKFKDYVFSETTQVNGIKKDGAPYQATGSWYIQVHETDSVLVPEGYTGPEKFEHVMRWEIKSGGFEGAPKASLMAFDSMIYYQNIKPKLSIPKIEIRSKLSDVMASMNSGNTGDMGGIFGGLGDALFSGVVITLTVRDYNSL